MDEAYHACWKTNRNISVFMNKTGLAKDDYSGLEQYYIQKVLKIVENLNQSYIIWQDPIDHGAKVRKEAIIEIWKGNDGTWKSYMANITKQGHQVILSSCWYLNYISYGQDWRKYYQCDPLDFPGTVDNYRRVVGGEVCMWTEYVDQTNLLSRLWPRASAAAERLWSANSVIQDTDSAAFRLDQHRCRMVKRGIPAEPILDGFCGDYELEDNSQSSSSTDKPCQVGTSSSNNIVLHTALILTMIVLVFV